MSKKQISFAGSIPENYDRYLGPLLFEFSAKDLAQRVSSNLNSAGEILELACGTGISTKYLRKALPDTVSIVATDISDAMLNIAKRGSLDGVEYQIADATDLSYDDNRFEAVVCQFGIMFFPDKHKGMSEIVRVLKPDGTLTLNVWDSTEYNPVIAVAQKTIEKFFTANPPKFLRIPFGYNDVGQIKKLMQNAGLSKVESNIVSITSEDMKAKDIARGVVTGNPTVAKINETSYIEVEDVIKAVTQAIEKTFGSGKPKIELQEIVFTGTKL